MEHVVVMTESKGRSTLKGYPAELVHITIKMIVTEVSTMQILHQFIGTVLSVNICLTVVQKIYNHLEIEVIDGL